MVEGHEGRAPPQRMASRLALAYAAHFAAHGVLLPYWPLWLAGRGLSAGEIGVVLAVGPLLRVFAGPRIGREADRHGAHERTLRGLALGAALCGVAFLAAGGFVPLLLLSIPFAVFYWPIFSLLDTTAILASREVAGIRPVDYARVRLWGSLAFLATNLACGWFLEDRSREWIGVLVAAGLANTALAMWLLPRPHVPARTSTRRLALRALLRRRAFVVLVVTATLIQSSHACYYGFSTIHWERSGISRTGIGLLWAEGVLAEVVLFVFAARLLPWRPPALLLAGGLAGVARWIALEHATTAGALAAVQWLHAATFGMTHLAAVRWIARHVPARGTASAQTLLSAASAGIGTGIVTPIAGGLFEAYGARAFTAMAVLAGLGALGAVLLARIRPAATGTATSRAAPAPR